MCRLYPILFCLLSCSCKSQPDSPSPVTHEDRGALPSGTAQTSSGASAGVPPRAISPAGFACRIRQVDIVSMDPHPILDPDAVKTKVVELARKHFPPQQAEAPGGGPPLTQGIKVPGVRLYVQYALVEGTTGPRQYHFGALGFVKGPPGIRSTTLEADVTLDGPPPNAHSSLLDQVAAPGMDTLLSRLGILCRMETEGKTAVVAGLDSPDPWVRTKAAQAVGEQGLSELRPRLEKLVAESDLEVVLAAVAALGRLRATASIPLLVRRAERADERITAAVAVALSDMNDPTANRYLKEWARAHPLDSIRELATELLGP